MTKDPGDNIDRILQRCLKNDRKSQKALYMMFYAYGMSIGLRYAGSRDAAVEILNIAFMKIFRNLKKFDLSKPFKPWFRKILVNTAITHYKKEARNFKHSDLDSAGHIEAGEEILSGISYQEIINLIHQLSPAYRTVFNLYVIEGYKHEEIAEMLGISIGASKSNLSRAKDHLRRLLRELFEQDYERQK